MLLVFSGALGAVLFGATAWLGKWLADTRYAGVERHADGPLPLVLPSWVFIAVPAALGVVAGVRGATPVQGALLLLAVLALTVCAVTDCRTGMIPDLFTLGPASAVLAVSAVEREWMPLLGAAFAFVPFALIAAFSRGRGMGWGDVKLATLGGALVGLGGITLAVVAASLAAYLAGARKGRTKQPIAFGPYLAASIGAALGLGNPV